MVEEAEYYWRVISKKKLTWFQLDENYDLSGNNCKLHFLLVFLFGKTTLVVMTIAYEYWKNCRAGVMCVSPEHQHHHWLKLFSFPPTLAAQVGSTLLSSCSKSVDVYIWSPKVAARSCNLFIAHLVFERLFFLFDVMRERKKNFCLAVQLLEQVSSGRFCGVRRVYFPCLSSFPGTWIASASPWRPTRARSWPASRECCPRCSRSKEEWFLFKKEKTTTKRKKKQEEAKRLHFLSVKSINT